MSLLNINSKILEKCLFDAVYSHVQPYLTKLQYGFMKRRSTILQLLELTDRVYHALDSNTLSHVEIVFLDLAKAFDKVDHSVLTRKLWQWGFRGELFAVLKDYLRNRRQRVKLNGVLSDCLNVTSGVPQGSLLGPLLFLLYINDLPDCVREALPGLFADDVELFVAYENDTEDPVVDDLFRLKTWADENKRMFSADKFKSLVLKCSRDAPGHHRENLPITLHSVQKEKYLGVTITSSFSWSPHIKERCGNAMQSFFLIKRNSSSSLSFLSKLNLYVFHSTHSSLWASSFECKQIRLYYHRTSSTKSDKLDSSEVISCPIQRSPPQPKTATFVALHAASWRAFPL